MPSSVRVAGRRPARSLGVVSCTTRKAERPYVGLVEEVISDVGRLPSGVSVGRCVVTVNHQGHAPVQVANWGDRDVYLNPGLLLGKLEVAEVQPQIRTRQVDQTVIFEHVQVQSVGHAVMPGLWDRVNVSSELSAEQKAFLQRTLLDHQGIFLEDDNDVGHCTAVEHRIILRDEVPVKVSHRMVPPHQWAHQ